MKIILFLLLSFSAFTDDHELKGFKLYGNWCGPMHGGGEPIDELDQLCMEHDLCYKDRVMFSCYCDEELVLGIHETLFSMDEEAQSVASLIASYFSIAPCIDL